ncbi:helix-turn-helix domain-containing protein [Dactylosporangium sp. CA-233914]|uniref:helix-turn-helix domain-containing protein n=1 Tax=Dactylosporangium sp. CA-233914 TaxID=3239934 RepID=UPI003D8E63DA
MDQLTEQQPLIIRIVLVLADTEAAAPPPQPCPGWHCLTERERTVAGLAGRALTNRQIARRLGITQHTVNYHLRQIFRKLEITSRVSLAGYAKPP